MKKTFCIDTNVLIYDPFAIFAFQDNDVVIPLVVLEEIDSLKDSRHDEAGKNARVTNRLLDDLRQQGNLVEGVDLPGGGKLRIVKLSDFGEQLALPSELNKLTADNIIIATASALSRQIDNVKLITKDISMRIKCDSMHVACEDYLKHRVAGKSDLIYGGVRVIDVGHEMINEFYINKNLDASQFLESDTFMPNEYFVLKGNNEQASALAKYDVKQNVLKQIIEVNDAWGLKPKNKEQKFALDALFDDNAKLVTMIGRAGCGKTILAIAAGLQQVLELKKYNRLIITRPIQPVGRDIGYLPGTKQEKMEPWVQPIVDNIETLFNANKRVSNVIKMYMESGLIEVEAITYIRGRSIPNTYMIIDEAQNLTAHELKTIITRVGDSTKIVLTGDIDQIDNANIDAVSNGLTYAVEKFKVYDIASHVTLIKGERSELATLAAKIL